MTQERIDTYFNSSLGQQCEELFSTSDDRVFIRIEEARSHTGELTDKTIITWYPEEHKSTFNEHPHFGC